MDGATELKKLLLDARTLISGSNSADWSPRLKSIFNNICKLVFREQAYRGLWDEFILSLLEWLFRIKTPESTIYGNQVAELYQRTQQVRRVNDFFFRVINRDA